MLLLKEKICFSYLLRIKRMQVILSILFMKNTRFDVWVLNDLNTYYNATRQSCESIKILCQILNYY